MRILVIDDEPIRIANLIDAGHTVCIAHTQNQIIFWLQYGPWDLIILDHDLYMPYNGTDVCIQHGKSILSLNCPIRIWSHNPEGAKRMKACLEDTAKYYDINYDIHISPWGTEETDI